MWLAKQAVALSQSLRREKNLSLKAQLLRTLLHCWTVYLPDLILLSDFYVDNLKKVRFLLFLSRKQNPDWNTNMGVRWEDLHARFTRNTFSHKVFSLSRVRFTVPLHSGECQTWRHWESPQMTRARKLGKGVKEAGNNKNPGKCVVSVDV